MFDSIYSGLEGIRFHLESFQKTANRIAHHAPRGDLAKDVVQMMVDRQGIQINAATIKTADRMLGSLLDILA